jgi:hypothetical protein
MANDGKADREERLAAKLRENLRRRKAQARALGEASASGKARPRSGEVRTAPPKGNA